MSRHAPYIVNPTATTDAEAVHEYTPPAPQPPLLPLSPRHRKMAAPEQPPDAYHIAPGWIDTADRTRTWILRDPQCHKMAEICTKRDASKLADILNRVMPAEERGRSR